MNDELEKLVDQHGLTHVLNMLAVVCLDKAEHLESNWQDGASAKAWEADAKTIEQAALLICSDVRSAA